MKIQFESWSIWISRKEGRWVRCPWALPALAVATPVVCYIALGASYGKTSPYLQMRVSDPVGAGAYLSQAIKADLVNALFAKQPPVYSSVPTIQIYVTQESFKSLENAKETGRSNLGKEDGGDRPYVKAMYRDESGLLQESKVALRGFGDYHHYFNKPSLRVKIKKDQIANGYRYVELTRPKDEFAIFSQISQMLAESSGVMTMLGEPVRVFINDKYFGLYLRSCRPGEELAVNNQRMPGAFFKGDSLGFERDNILWANVEYWNTFGDVGPAEHGKFGLFLSLLDKKIDNGVAARLWNYLDFDRSAKLAALDIELGNTHTDGYHNHLYYFSSNAGVFQPVLWDPANNGKVEPDFIVNPVMELAIRNPVWVHRRNEELWNLINGAGSLENIDRFVKSRMRLTRDELLADVNLGRLNGFYHEPRSVLDVASTKDPTGGFFAWRIPMIHSYLKDAKVIVTMGNEAETLVTSFGRIAVRVVSADGESVQILDSVGGEVPLLYPGVSEPTLKPDAIYPAPTVNPEPVTYRINAPRNSLVFFNAITGAPIVPQLAGFPPASNSVSIVPSLVLPKNQGDVVLGPGTVTLREDLVVGEAQRLIIKPGTNLRLGAGVSVFSRGQTLVVGTRRQPITIQGSDKEPWGTFAVSGPKSKGSKFEFVHVSGGSSGTRGYQVFKGMFCVYDCPDVLIFRCEFGRNFVSDDTVNLAESNILVVGSTWRNANSDALDLDMCKGVVRDCKFYDSGNDALDLMTCKVRVRNCLFQGSGDKGISIGEQTHVAVLDSVIKDCNTGIEPKDNSRAYVQRTVFADNRTQIHCYQKKYIYKQGGECLLDGSQFVGKGGVRLEKGTALLAVGSDIGPSLKSDPRFRAIESIPEAWQQVYDEVMEQ